MKLGCFLLEAYVRSQGLGCECRPCEAGIWVKIYSEFKPVWSALYIFNNFEDAKKSVDSEIDLYQTSLKAYMNWYCSCYEDPAVYAPRVPKL